MAHHKSALKRIGVAERNNQRNRFYRATLRSTIKKVRTAESKESALESYKEASSLLDKLVVKRIVHRNQASNKKSRLMKFVNSLS